MHNFLHISSFNDGITTHLKGDKFENYSWINKIEIYPYNSKSEIYQSKGTWRSKLGVYEY